MSLLVVGMSHRSAPVSVLDRAALSGGGVAALLADVRRARQVSEAAVLATCNRLEVYADVARFHAGVDELRALLAVHTGIGAAELGRHLYVHYEDRAVQHLFSVTAGLDSMAVGEAQVLGQVRTALRQAQEAETAGRVLNDAFQAALRSGKRVHAETGIDGAGRSLVRLGLTAAEPVVGGLAGRSAVVVGAGSMASLAVTTLRDAGARVTVVNRTPDTAARLAASVGGRSAGLAGLPDLLADADVVVSCTGSSGVVLSADTVRAARRVAAGRPGSAPLALVDLALPHDIDPGVVDVPGVVLVDLATLAQEARAGGLDADVESARDIVDEEVALHLGEQRADRVAPTVVALRSMADDVVESELARLGGRLPAGADPAVDAAVRAEVAATVRRVVDKLLHAPTVRVKELARGPEGPVYEAALRELFSLDPAAVEAVARVPEDDGGAS